MKLCWYLSIPFSSAKQYLLVLQLHLEWISYSPSGALIILWLFLLQVYWIYKTLSPVRLSHRCTSMLPSMYLCTHRLSVLRISEVTRRLLCQLSWKRRNWGNSEHRKVQVLCLDSMVQTYPFCWIHLVHFPWLWWNTKTQYLLHMVLKVLEEPSQWLKDHFDTWISNTPCHP